MAFHQNRCRLILKARLRWQGPGTVELEIEQPEARLDLEFGSGLTLSGVVTANGEPWPAATVTAFGPGGVAAWTETDRSGLFQLSGLEEGEYLLEVLSLDRDVRHQQPIVLDTDLDVRIDLSTAESGAFPGGKGGAG